MPPILGGYGNVDTPDIMGGTQSTYQPPPPQPYTYIAPAGAISGVAGGTVFTGDEAKRVESYVEGVAYEQAVYDANNPEQTIYDRITTANAETVDTVRNVVSNTYEQAAETVSAPFGIPLPLVAAVGLLFLTR